MQAVQWVPSCIPAPALVHLVALRHMLGGVIAPEDLAQVCVGWAAGFKLLIDALIRIEPNKIQDERGRKLILLWINREEHFRNLLVTTSCHEKA